MERVHILLRRYGLQSGYTYIYPIGLIPCLGELFYNYGIPIYIYIYPIGLIPCLGEVSYNYGIPIYIHPIGLIPCLGEVGYNYGIPIHLKWGRQQPSDSPIYQLEKARLVFKIESSGKVKEIYVQVVNVLPASKC